MVMEHFSGGTVADRLRSGREIPRALALRWLREAAEALDCAHRHDVVHRDVKPANLLIDERGRLAVGDFGIATVAAETSLTQTGQVLGTAAYISPEQARGHMATDASDRYALAVVAFELLTGRRPFTADHPAAQARAHVEDSVPSASAAGGLPAEVDRVLSDGDGQGARGAPGDRRGLPRRPGGRHRRRAGAGADRGHRPDRERRRGRPPGRSTSHPPPHGAAGPASPPWPRSRSWPAWPSRSPPGPATTEPPPPARQAPPERPAHARSPRPRPRPRRRRRRPRRSADDHAAAHPDADADQQTTTQAPAAGAQAKADDPVALNDQGFALIGQGRPADAVAPLQRSVDAFRAQDRKGDIGYAYALYNLGNALRLSGHPAEAIPYLQERLQVSNYKRGVVQKELKIARQRHAEPTFETPPIGGGASIGAPADGWWSRGAWRLRVRRRHDGHAQGQRDEARLGPQAARGAGAPASAASSRAGRSSADSWAQVPKIRSRTMHPSPRHSPSVDAQLQDAIQRIGQLRCSIAPCGACAGSRATPSPTPASSSPRSRPIPGSRPTSCASPTPRRARAPCAQTVRQAVNLLGRVSVGRLALEAAVCRFFELAPGTGGASRGLLHVHASQVAAVAGALAERAGADAEAAHLAGLLHDLGKLVMPLAFGEAELDAVAREHAIGARRAILERERFGVDHAYAGEVFAREAFLEARVFNAIGAHHGDSVPSPEAACVQAANAAVHLLHDLHADAEVLDTALAELSLDPAVLDDVLPVALPSLAPTVSGLAGRIAALERAATTDDAPACRPARPG